ncbi:alpha/beta hydrolase [Paenibacillus sp. FSL P2-0121]|uniref:alpha/beta hydrolase n=1 Tax=Paenibacillus sp. FSL P2-0121 TaxID=2921626 RepID=UPI0030CE35DA
MEKTSTEQLAAIKDYLRQSNRWDSKSIGQIRQEMAATAANMPSPTDVIVERVMIGTLSGEWIIPVKSASPADEVILYFHGGGFISGTCEFYRDLVTRIAKASGKKILVIEYRLAPEFTYPAANEDCIDAYLWLLANGYSAGNVVLGGDSVGASLVLMTLITLRDAGGELPAGAFLISPHTDLVHLDGESYLSRAEFDPTGSLKGNNRIIEFYLGARTELAPILSPLRLDLQGLPDLLVQVGDHEVLLSDATRLAERAQAADVHVELEIWENMWSVFHFLAYMLPEAQQAIANVGKFVRTRLDRIEQKSS